MGKNIRDNNKGRGQAKHLQSFVECRLQRSETLEVGMSPDMK
jgi:hypothetical protein